MKKILILFALLAALLPFAKTDAQTLVCNDFVTVSVNPDCQFTVEPEHILEGTILPNCVVELDKTLPYGNGPWVPAIAGPDDINMAYIVRVRHIPSGNICWGNIEFVDKIDPTIQCSGLSTVALDASGQATISPNNTATVAIDGCTPSNELDFSFSGGQSSLSFDCLDLGINIVNVTVGDASGNTATCQTTVLVHDPLNACQPCLSECPDPVAVSFATGTGTLLPAFQIGDYSVFDPYGDAAYNTSTCPPATLTYSVEYFPGTAGQSWFERHWWWKDVNDQPLGHCEQVITYGSTQVVNMQGTVYLDNDNMNCTLDAGEPGVDYFSINLTKLPSGDSYTFYPGNDGTYNLNFELNLGDTSALVQINLPSNINTVCPNAVSIPYTGVSQSIDFDFGLRTLGDCAVMQANMGSYSNRRCQSNIYYIQYCNAGLDTAYDAYLVLDLDPLISLQSSALPYTTDTAGNYVFQLGDVNPFECNIFTLTGFISCDAELGQTLCNTATVYPNTPCNGAWTGPQVVTTARCAGGSVELAIWNQGNSDMPEPLDFIVIEDFIMYKDGPFQLTAGDSITILAPANGATWRIEAEQANGHPWPGIVSAAIEGCGGLNAPGLITAFPQNDREGFVDEYCAVVTGSYDPNDKTAVPTGYGPEHRIRANEPLEYKIRFQNTGNDTAFAVVIVDTLSTLLDWNTLEAGVASHPYRLEIYPGGILHFIFDPIALPDSTTNLAGSQGFVNFRINQVPNLYAGAVIENTAAIYFDNNDPIITNTAFHTIDKLDEVALQSQTPFLPGVTATLSPNPFSEQAVLDIHGPVLQQGMLNLYDAQGRLLRTQVMQGNRGLIERQGLPAGICFFQVTDNGAVVVTGKLIVE